MHSHITHDNSIAAAGFAALLRDAQPGLLPGDAPLHILSTGLPHCAGQAGRVHAAVLSGACVVLETLPPRAHRARMRVRDGRLFILDANLPLNDLRLAACFIILSLWLTRVMQAGSVWAQEVLVQTSQRLAPQDIAATLTPAERRTLTGLLSGRPLVSVARRAHRATKTVSSHKRTLMRKLNAFTMVELHFRLCMEKCIQPADTGRLYAVRARGEEPDVPPSATPGQRELHRELLRLRLQACLSAAADTAVS